MPNKCSGKKMAMNSGGGGYGEGEEVVVCQFQVIIQTPSVVDEQKEIVLLLQGSSKTFSVRMRSPCL